MIRTALCARSRRSPVRIRRWSSGRSRSSSSRAAAANAHARTAGDPGCLGLPAVAPHRAMRHVRRPSTCTSRCSAPGRSTLRKGYRRTTATRTQAFPPVPSATADARGCRSHRPARRASTADVVHHDRSAGSGDPEHCVRVILRARAVDEEEIERTMWRENCAPVALENVHVRVVGEEPRGRNRPRLVALGRVQGHAGRQGRREPRCSDPRASPDLADPLDATSSRENVKQAPVSVATARVEAERHVCSAGAGDERRHVHAASRSPRRSS